MALAESTTITEVTVLPAESHLQVKRSDVVTRDGKPISCTDRYRLFSVEERDDFAAQVPNAQAYITAVGW